VNGKERSAEVDDRTLLVELIRDHFRLTGTHVGCDTSQCGACTVHMDGRSVKSCTVLAGHANGRDIRTIEGVGSPAILHPLQQAFHDHHGLQCGYCTPGMIMASLHLLEVNSTPNEHDVRHWLEGNICRCTGYHNIVEAVLAASRKMQTGTTVAPPSSQE
jgi:carbon-monoxide dehydrogenase small subunit